MDVNQSGITRRRLFGIAGALGGGLAVSACGGSSSKAASASAAATSAASTSGAVTKGTTTIKFVGMGSSTASFRARADVFQKANPGIKVNVEAIPANSWGELLQTLSVDIAGGDIPDVADIASEGQRAFAENNVTLPIDSYLARDAADLAPTLADIDPALLEAMKIDGKTYGLPTVWNSMVMYVNKAVLKEAGVTPPTDSWTFDDFMTMSQKVVASGGGRWGYCFSNAYFLTLAPWMVANGGNILSDDWKTSRLLDPATVGAVQLLHDMIYKSKIAPKLDANVTDLDLFTQGKLAFMGAGLWDVNSLKLAKFDPADYDVVTWPKISANPQRAVVGIGAAPIFSASKHPDDAWEFAKFLSSKDFQETYVVNDGWSIPATRGAFTKMMQRPDFPKNGHIFYDLLKGSVLVPSPKSYGAIEAALLREFSAAMADSKSVAAAMASANKDVTTALNGA